MIDLSALEQPVLCCNLDMEVKPYCFYIPPLIQYYILLSDVSTGMYSFGVASDHGFLLRCMWLKTEFLYMMYTCCL